MDGETCPGCGSGDMFTVQCEGGPHYARTGCTACGRHIRWEPAPMMDDRAASFVMPFGKHRGRPLGEIPRDYLIWLLKAAEPKASLRRHVEHELERRDAGRPAYDVG